VDCRTATGECGAGATLSYLVLLSPYVIDIDSKCYQSTGRIVLKLHASNYTLQKFKGFAIQAREVGTNNYVGKFIRDDNGSWRYQCFTNKAAATHSHSTPKEEMLMWWSYDDQSTPPTKNVQFMFVHLFEAETGHFLDFALD
jgi:hypothetical protein